ncbi:hypothetical protein G6011_01191 [Alternaria panax]|uniref:Heterokaryon incompatibility domain-containing protein n=1 Tax=Alternaria panax TaxID=48097 RepID=A0AAD4IKD0_9PLEO|nr:hypothetical protein G6011_01191 [Alternaria panax]
MEETTSPPAHSCVHCTDIVLPGSPEEIYVSYIGPPEDPFGRLHFSKEKWYRLDLSWVDLRLGANAGCDFSQYLKNRIEDKMYKDVAPDAVQLYNPYGGTSAMLYPLICLQSLHLPDDISGGDDPKLGVEIRRPMSLDPLSSRTVTDVRGWMKQCEDERDSHHKICALSERAYVPTRLIKISGPLDRLRLTMVRGEDLEEDGMSKYVALSYCWGGDQPSKLTQENHDLYKTGIPWDTLPRTIQDAVKTAQALGFRYIWIDSMCIIQDSREDKAMEINQMTRVYAHATLTVVNERGDRVTNGFLHARKLPSGTSLIQLRTDNGQTNRVTLTFHDASKLEESFAVNTRGWTMQECLLSRRRLIIGTWSTEWRCRRKESVHRDGWVPNHHKEASDGNPFAYNAGSWAVDHLSGSEQAESVYKSHFIDAAMFFSVNSGYPSGQLIEHTVHRHWYNLVDAYSSRSVTESTDRILAISGIAERFATFIPKRYIAGLWEDMMPGALFWRMKSSNVSDRPTEYQGPSWSWASIVGGVQRVLDENCMCEVLSIDYELKMADALYGAVSSATLHIKGPALHVEWQYTRSKRSPSEDLSNFRWRREGCCDELEWRREGYAHGQTEAQNQYLDAREQSTEWSEVVLLAHELSKNPHKGDHRITYCVALIRIDQIEVGNKPRERYRRLGSMRFFEDSPLPLVESWPISSYYVI